MSGMEQAMWQQNWLYKGQEKKGFEVDLYVSGAFFDLSFSSLTQPDEPSYLKIIG